jgi:hypothetical protein
METVNILNCPKPIEAHYFSNDGIGTLDINTEKIMAEEMKRAMKRQKMVKLRV